MKRNWDTIREILLALEASPDMHGDVSLGNFSTDRAEEISYHAGLLLEAGLVNGQMHETWERGASDFVLERLTWNGHEFLDAVRSETVWNKTKKSFLSNGVSMTLDVIRSVATDVAASLIKASL